ncbi:MAG: TIGR00159 family protein [Planctomycetota bacterium]|nr:MAG: TIGR00159 family protein [Planctomycetota bacterium]
MDWLPDLGLRQLLQRLIEIATLTVAYYGLLRFLRSTRGGGLLRGLGVFVSITLVLYALFSIFPGVPVLVEILRQVGGAIVLILVILFQPELRQGIARFGRGGLLRFLGQEERSTETAARVARAAQRMAKERIGALIAFERGVSLAPYSDNAVPVDAPVSGILLETIFFPGGPLHDGAVVIREDRIQAAACLLPLADPSEELGRLGTRHRAALGLSEETDAVTLVVSEETGQISLCSAGRLMRQIPLDQIEEKLVALLHPESEPEPAAADEEASDAAVAAAKEGRS